MSTPENVTPLTQQEQQQIARLLGDPYYFPLAFKTWIQWLIEGGPGGIAGGGAAGAGGGGGGGVPIGGIYFWTAAVLPASALACNGAAVSRVAYNALFQIIGTDFGVGDGSTTFNVPDLQGRTLVGQGTHVDVNARIKSDGLPVAQRTPRHGTSFSDPGHGHTINDPSHNHGAHSFDSGHTHNYTAPNAAGAGASASGAVGDITATGAVTTIGIANISTSIDGAGTGITINGNGSGVSVGLGAGRPQDAPAYMVLPVVIRYI